MCGDRVIKGERKKVAPITFESHVFDCAFHPSVEQQIVAACLITGHIHCYRYGEDAHEPLFISDAHKDSCRAVEFSNSGSELYSAGSDKSLLVIDSATGKLRLRKPSAHDESINRLKTIGEGLVVSGDDGGVVKIWDLRQRKDIMTYNVNSDAITDFDYLEEKNTMVATSADGSLSVFDIRKKKPIKVSDNQEDELLSVSFFRGGKKVVVGTQGGVLSFFSFGDWGDCTDRFPGHPGSIDTICKVDEDTILTGSEDGLIRVVGLFPNRLIGVLGDHGNVPVERIRLSGGYAGSISHDNRLAFWKLGGDGETGDESEEFGTGPNDTVYEEAGDETEEEQSVESSDAEYVLDENSNFSEPEIDDREDEKEGEEQNPAVERRGTDKVGKSNSEVMSSKIIVQKGPLIPKRPSSDGENEQKSDSDVDEDEDGFEDTSRKKRGRKKAKRGIGGSQSNNFFKNID